MKSIRRNPQAWWRHGYLWLVLAGPLLVVLASFVTLWLALSRPDPVLEGYGSSARANSGVNAQPSSRSDAPPQASGSSLTPALTARNHAATGAVPARP